MAQNPHRILRGKDIAVGDDRDRDGLLDLADGVPVRPAAVHLDPGPAMDGEGRNACLLQGQGDLHGVQAALVPAPADLGRDGDGRGLYHRLRDAGRLFRIPHEGGAVAVGDDFSHGTTHVDVNDVRAGKLRGHLGRLCHTGGITSEQLDGGGVFPRKKLQKLLRLLIVIAERLGGDQLCIGVARALLRADLAERDVRDARHGGESQPGFDFHRADFHEVNLSFAQK